MDTQTYLQILLIERATLQKTIRRLTNETLALQTYLAALELRQYREDNL